MATQGLSAVSFPAPKLREDGLWIRKPSLFNSCWQVPRRCSLVECKAVRQKQRQSSDSGNVYEGVYGPWTIDSSDVQEVVLYRSGLVTAAASFVLAASAAFLPDNSSLSAIIKSNLDILYVLGSGGLGISLLLIHIYVSKIKHALQALWVLGVLGSFAAYTSLARPANDNLIQYIVDNPSAVWLVGPLFAALTGLVFKEGLCYGKLEAGLLTFIIPLVLLGHLVFFFCTLN